MAISPDIKKTFMPPKIPAGGFPVRVLPLGYYKAPPPTDASIQRDRAIGQYGYNLIDQISKDYVVQVDRVWKPAFSDVIAAFATAVESRNKTLEILAAEREREAEFNAFVFSLLTAGAMRFLGAYVQYTFIPSLKNVEAKWDFSKGPKSIPGLKITETDKFSRLQASAFGGIVQDIGNRVAEGLFPDPVRKAYNLDSWSGVFNLQADVTIHIDKSAKIVLDQFSDIQKWMNESTEFGAAWIAITDGNVENARVMVRARCLELRNQWARQWEFFGKSPKPIIRSMLAEKYERALWAGYIINQLENTMFFDTLVGKAVVNRLKELNIIFAQTLEGTRDQANRMIQGAPRPSITVRGSVLDDIDEWDESGKWAVNYLKNSPSDAKQEFFPDAILRQLPSL